MNRNSPARNLGLASVLAQDLSDFNEGVAVGARQLKLAGVLDEVPNIFVFSANQFRPAYTLVQTAAVQMIGYLGATTPALATMLYNATASRTHPARYDGFNGAAWEVQDLVRGTIGGVSNFTLPRIIYYGHSFGGMIALAQAGETPRDRSQEVSVLTFGAPRTVRNQTADDKLSGVDICRYNVFIDSVVRFPPRANEAIIMGALETETQLDNLARWRHVGDGITLSPYANPVTELLPPLASVFTDMSLWNFLINNDSLTAVGHRIAAYASLTYAGAVADGSIAIDPPGPALTPLSRPQLEPVGQSFPDPAGQTQVAAVEAQFVGQANATRAFKPYKWVRTNEGPGVFYNGQQIAWFDNKRSARNFANSLNRAFHEWWKSRFGAVQTLESSVDDLFNPANI